jgi:hypothetical protein
MKNEDWKQEFPSMPEEVRTRIAQTVAQQVGTPSPKKKHTAGRTALLILAAALALSGTALAVTGHGGFYDLFFGTRAVGQEEEAVVQEGYDYTFPDEEKGVTVSVHMPGYELVAMDEEEADRLLGAYVQDRNDSYTVDGYTVTILGYIQDEAGSYRLYYSIENPNGLENIAYYDDRGYTGVGAADAQGFRVMPDGSTAYADTARSTDTKVYVCVPGTVHVWSEGADLAIIPAGYPEQEATYITVTSDNLVPALSEEGGNYQVSLSPMAIRVAQKTAYENNIGFQLRSLSITMADGTVYVVEGEDLNNTSYRCCVVDENGHNTAQVDCFNRLIDPAQVVSVTVQGIEDESETVIEF